MEKKFCPWCGYKTLQRVVVLVDSDGNRVFRERRKPISTKGLRVIVLLLITFLPVSFIYQ